ncbi:MAG: ATP-binding protein [Actinomycetota bacterium]|nr:ATP-binding protein [Actinomycetota bacterium]
MLHDALREFARDHAGTIPVSLTLHAPRFLIHGDPEHVKSILENLTRNAANAGSTRVEIIVKANSDSKSVILVVQDDGPGLHEDRLATLFRPFADGGRAEGTGLGLYLSRRYVDLLGGRIDASNREAGGAAFRILLPGRLATDVGARAAGN